MYNIWLLHFCHLHVQCSLCMCVWGGGGEYLVIFIILVATVIGTIFVDHWMGHFPEEKWLW